MSAPIRCEHLSKRYRGVVAIDDLQLEVPEGSIYALLGPNGAGKTTLLKMLVNLLRPTAGSALVLDTDSRRLSPRQFEEIGYVSENQELPEWMTVDYFLAYLKPFYGSWDDALVRELVREFQLPGNRRLGQLSRGMKMKVALASSLAFRPRLLILDEPFSGLDALVRDELIRGLLELAAGMTILVSSHDLGEIESFASHVGFLDGGRLQFSEEAAVLTGRFREISVTLPGGASLPAKWPESWSKPESSGAMVRFVESRFASERTAAMVADCFPGTAPVSMSPLSLREIFVAIAQEQRQAPRGGDQ